LERLKHRKSFSGCLFAVVLLTTWQPCLASGSDSSVVKRNKFSRVFRGLASFYGKKFQGKKTASGKPFDNNAFTCAHPDLPFGTPVLVQNSSNGAQCQVIVTDRGPHSGNRCIDLSKAAAKKLGITGVAKVICKTGRYVASGFDKMKSSRTKVASHD